MNTRTMDLTSEEVELIERLRKKKEFEPRELRDIDSSEVNEFYGSMYQSALHCFNEIVTYGDDLDLRNMFYWAWRQQMETLAHRGQEDKLWKYLDKFSSQANQ